MKSKVTGLVIAAYFLMVLVVTVSPASAVMTLDPTFKPVLSSAATIRAMAPLPNGQSIVIGTFTSVGGTAAEQVVRLNANGTVDTTFTPDPELQIGQIHAVAVQSDGKILLGGYLTLFGPDFVQSYLFRLNSDGSRDTTFNAGGYDQKANSSYGIDNLVRAIVVDGNGKIIVGGDFTTPGNHIARLNSDGTLDSSFSAAGGADGPVTLLARQSDGRLIIGGAFSTVNGVPKSNIARLAQDGSLDVATFGSGFYGGSLLALAVQSDDRILVGGDFFMLNGMDVPKLLRLNADGTVDSSFTQIIPTTSGTTLAANMFQSVTSLLPLPDKIVVGGWYSYIIFNGKPTDHNARLFVLEKNDGSFVNSASFKGKPTDVFALATRSDGSVLAGGSFIQLDDSSEAYYPGLCRLAGSSLTLDSSFKPMFGGQSDLRSVALQADGKYLAAGNFYMADGVPLNGLVRLNGNGSVDAAFHSPVIAGGTVNGVLARDDGKVVMGGTFYSVSSLDYKDLALLSPTGSVEASAYVGGVNALSWYPGGKIMAATPHSPGIVRLNGDLSADGSFSPGSGISNAIQTDGELDRVNTTVVQPDGKILVGGSFATFSGTSRQNIVRLNSDGSLDSNFTSPLFTVFNFRSEVFALAVQDDGKILVAGRFSTVNGTARPTLVRLNADGTVDPSFSAPILDSGGTAYAVALLADGRIAVGGSFQVIEGENIFNSLVVLNADGSRDVSFGSSLTGTVHALLVGGSQLIAGGAFSRVDTSPRYGVARFLVQAPPAATTGAATSIGAGGASLQGTVVANNAATTVVFEYGPTIAYGSSIGAGTVPAGSVPTLVGVTLTGLTPATTYYYRLVAQNVAGTAYGDQASFTTAPADPAASYLVTAVVAGAGGTISPASKQVKSGATASFTLKPGFGYAIGQVSGCGGTLAGSVYTTGPIQSDCAVKASFSPLPMELTITTKPLTRPLASSGKAGSVAFTVTGAATTDDIAGTVSVSDSWITPGILTYSGKGKGTLKYSVSANESSQPRQGTITIAGKSFTLGQAAKPCKLTVSVGTTQPLSVAGGKVSVAVAIDPPDGNWSVTGVKWSPLTTTPWLDGFVVGKVVTGNGTLSLTAVANSTGKARSAVLTLQSSDGKSKKTVTVKQAK